MRASRQYLPTLFLATALSAAAATALGLFVLSGDNPLAPGLFFFGFETSGFLLVFLRAWGTILSAVILAMLPALTLGIFLSVFAPPSEARRVRFLLSFFAAVPSVLYGWFFFTRLSPHLGNAFPVAPLVFASMLCPTMAKHTAFTLEAVPKCFLEASAALGADLWQTTRFVVLPAARWGVLCGIIAGLGRALGESTVLLFLADKMRGANIAAPASLKLSLLCCGVLFLLAVLLGTLLQARLRRRI